MEEGRTKMTWGQKRKMIFWTILSDLSGHNFKMKSYFLGRMFFKAKQVNNFHKHSNIIFISYSKAPVKQTEHFTEQRSSCLVSEQFS